MQFPQEGLPGLLLGGLIWSVVIAILFLVPLWRSLSRAGFSPSWSLLILIPYLWPVTIFGIVGVLAFGQWPAVVGPAERTTWTAFSKSSWVQVSPEEAAKNRYYGFDGWILAFYGIFATSIVSSTFYVFDPIYLQILKDNYGLAPEGATVLSVAMVIWSVVLLIVVPVKRPLVPRLLVAGVWLYLLIHWTILFAFGATTPMSFMGVGAGIAYTSLFSWYWLKSKRVNVTYLNRIPAS